MTKTKISRPFLGWEVLWRASCYLFVGVVNSAFGFGVMFALMAFGVGVWVANALGYVCGIGCSFVLNSCFTFKRSKTQTPRALKTFLLFCCVMGIAYGANLLMLWISYEKLGFNGYLCQILAGGVYTLVGFIGSQYFVFRGEE